MKEPRVRWMELRAEEIRAHAKQDAIVILPVAALEQHGPHLPTGTDTYIGEETARRIAILASDKRPTLVLPPLWSGLSEHHMALGGTITLDFQSFIGVIRGIVGSLKRHGFRRVLLLNSHGGNVAALKTVAEELTREFALPIVTTTVWRVAQEELDAVLESQDGIKHACEGETSMILALRPELVDRSRLADGINAEGAKLATYRGDDTYRWQSFAEKTPQGVIGNPTLASTAKGERLFEISSSHLASLIVEDVFWGLA